MTREEQRIKEELSKKNPDEVYQYITDIWNRDRPSYRKYHLDEVKIRYPRIGVERGIPTLYLKKEGLRLDLHGKSQKKLAAIDFYINTALFWDFEPLPPRIVEIEKEEDFIEALGEEWPKFKSWYMMVREKAFERLGDEAVVDLGSSEKFELPTMPKPTFEKGMFTLSSAELANIPDEEVELAAKSGMFIKDMVLQMDSEEAYSMLSVFWTANKKLYKLLRLDEERKKIENPFVWKVHKKTRQGYYRLALGVDYYGFYEEIYGDYEDTLMQVQHYIYNNYTKTPTPEPPGVVILKSEEEFMDALGSQKKRVIDWLSIIENEKELVRREFESEDL